MPARGASMVHVVAAFGLAGLASGWLLADTFTTTAAMRAFVAAQSAAVTGLLARVLGEPRTNLSYLSRCLLGLAAAGSIDALLLAAAAWIFLMDVHSARSLGVVLAAIPIGAALAIATFPVFVPLALLVRREGRARPGSLVAAADRRAVVLFSAAVLGAASLASPRRGGIGHDLGALLLAVGSAALAGSLAAGDAVAYRRLARLAAPRLRAKEDSIDLGIGDGRRAISAHSERGAYRSPEEDAVVVVGDERSATTILRWAFARDGAALTAAAVEVGHALWRLAR